MQSFLDRMKRCYSINNRNLLVIKSPKKKTLLAAQGKLAINKNNQLIYRINEPASWRRTYDLPNKINFKGNWRINSNYDLELNLDEIKEQYKSRTRVTSVGDKGDRLILKGEIISANKDALTFEIKSYDKHGLTHIQILELSGFWQANEYNQISFVVKKKTLPDILTLKGIWQINSNQQIIYNYEKTDLKAKTRAIHSLGFEGFWEINSVNRLTYILSHSLKSQFDFRVQIESPNIYPQKGVIKYRLGIGLRKERAYQNKIISLYGTWKFNRKLGLVFSMDYGKNRLESTEFGTNIYLTKKDEITFLLRDKRKEPLGIYVTFTHRFLKKLDAEAFVRLKEIFKKETAVETGIRIPF